MNDAAMAAASAPLPEALESTAGPALPAREIPTARQSESEGAGRAPAAAAAPMRRIKLGDINAAIAPMAISAEGLAQLGFLPVGQERAAKLNDAAQVPAMCKAMQQILANVANGDRYALAA